MLRCPKFKRKFKSKHQSHSCTNIDVGALFIGKPDELILAFNKITQAVKHWQPNEFATAKKILSSTQSLVSCKTHKILTRH